MSEKQYAEKPKAEHELLTGPVWLRPGGQHEPDVSAAQAHASLGVFFKGWGMDGDIMEPKKQTTISDTVNHPKHYASNGPACPNCGSNIECITITERMGFCLGNAVKYIWRHKNKGNALEDLKKARWYLDREIARMEAE